jgi:hypothetical protein
VGLILGAVVGIAGERECDTIDERSDRGDDVFNVHQAVAVVV